MPPVLESSRMRVLILGCNKLTTILVTDLARAGSQVTVVAREREYLERIIDEPHVEAILATEPQMQDYLQQGGIDNTDVFLALSGDDHRNTLAAQIALHIFNVPKVVCYLEDPQLQVFFSGLGMNVVGHSFGLLQEISDAVGR